MKALFYVVLFLQLCLVHPIYAQKPKVLEHKLKVTIVELSNLNSERRECNLSLSPDGQSIYFMSTRKLDRRNRWLGDGDLYSATLNNNKQWNTPVSLNSLNTSNGEDEPSVSFDGSRIYYQSWNDNWENNGGPYYEAQIENGMASRLKGLGGGINDFFRERSDEYSGYATDGMAVSPDGQLFIVACGSSYTRSMDLYYSYKVSGTWSYPKKLDVSTNSDERSVFIAADNHTFYFSSSGYDGFGGLDIYKSDIYSDSVGPIVNIGEPFNSRANDMGFVISGSGSEAFFVRDLDIWYANLAALDGAIKPIRSLLIKGIVQVKDSSKNHRIFVKRQGKLLAETSSDLEGKYAVSVPYFDSIAEISIGDDSLGIYAVQQIAFDSSDRYREYKINFQAENTIASKTTPSLKKDLQLKELVIYFGFDDFNLGSDNEKDIDEFVQMTKTDRFAVLGHTDRQGTSSYNEGLSKKRAESVASRLREKFDISSDAIEIKALGESKLLNPGKNDIQRAKNRRVVLRMIEN